MSGVGNNPGSPPLLSTTTSTSKPPTTTKPPHTQSSASSTSASTTRAHASASSTLPAPSPSPSPTSKAQDIGAITGGVIGGVALLVLTAMFIFCYRKYKGRKVSHPSPAALDMLEPFTSPLPPTDMVSISPGIERSIHRTSTIPAPADSNSGPPGRTSPRSSSPAPSPPLSDGPSTNLLKEVGLLRTEVAQLRQLHTTNQSRESVDWRSSAPPEYSEAPCS